MPDEKMKYPLLEFEYDKKPYEKLLGLKPHPKFMDKTKPSSEEYMHDSFGFVTGDETNVLAHAVYILKELEALSAPSDHAHKGRESLLWELNEDFSNYCYCVKYGSGSKEKLLAFMEAMCFYGCDKRVYDEVIEWYQDTVNGYHPSESSVFNFDAFYIKMGDRFLFLKNDFSAAQKFYSLSTLEWRIDTSLLTWSVGEDHSVDFGREYELLTSLAQGNFCVPDKNLGRIPFYRLYNDILSSFSSQKDSSQLSQLVAEFTQKAKSLLNNPTFKNLLPKRSVLLMMIVLTQKLLISELVRLADDDFNRDLKKDLVIQKAPFLKSTTFQPLALAANQLLNNPRALSYDDYLQLVKTADLSNFLLTELDAEISHSQIAYYTSTAVFSYMLPVKCTGDKKDRLGRLTVMHLSYMNDPNEGQTLRKALALAQDSAGKKKRKELNVPYVFIKCFSPRVDYLPMWEMYGDHAKGCCLVINWAKSKQDLSSNDPVLYRVCYLQKKDGRYRADPSDNQGFSNASETCARIDSCLNDLTQIAASLSKSALSYFDDLLDKTRYLFKDSSYSYEQELRVIYQTKENILHTDGDKPWLFVQTPFPLQLDEVILGPKFPDVSTRVPYLQEQLDLMCEKTGTEKPRITLSEIDYR